MKLGAGATQRVAELTKQVNRASMHSQELAARLAQAERAAAPLQQQLRLQTAELSAAKEELRFLNARPTPPAPEQVAAAVNSTVSEEGEVAETSAGEDTAVQGELYSGAEWTLKGLIASESETWAETIAHALTRPLRCVPPPPHPCCMSHPPHSHPIPMPPPMVMPVAGRS